MQPMERRRGSAPVEGTLTRGLECDMEFNLALSRRGADGQRQEELLGNTFQLERGVIRKAKARIKSRVAYKKATSCPEFSKLTQSVLDEGAADSSALKRWNN